MSTRSTLGCRRCKTIRKKCDEAKPECFRCLRCRIECRYELVESKGEGFVSRTRPGRRHADELERIKQASLKTTLASPRLVLATPMLSSAPASMDSLESVIPPSAIDPGPLIFGADTRVTQSMLFPQSALVLDPSMAFSYSLPHQPTPTMVTNSETGFYNDLINILPDSNPSTCLQIAQKEPSPQMEDGDEELDVEGVKLIIYATPYLGNPWSNSSIEFVLQNCRPLFELLIARLINALDFQSLLDAMWLPIALFDPLKVAHKTKQDILYQFSLSTTSRSRVLLVAQLMNSLKKNWVLDEQGSTVLGLLRNVILGNMYGCSLQYPISDEARQQASSALGGLLELMFIQVVTSPLSAAIQLREAAAPVFFAACPPPHPPHLLDIFFNPSLDLRHFVVLDIALSVSTGRKTLCSYYVPWSLELSERLLERKDNQGTEWLIGIPEQFVMVLAYMSALREDAQKQAFVHTSSGYAHHAESGLYHTSNDGAFGNAWGSVISPGAAEKLEDDIRRIRILPGESKDPALAITRVVVQECWREVVHIYFYMAICGVSAEDRRVQQSQKKYMRLLNGIKPGRNPDAFLIVPMVIAGLAATKPRYRRDLISRTLGLPECFNPRTVGNDLVRILENVWSRTATEGRPACWDDLSIACRMVTGM
ncbi:unnamed protein product [Rhizoctonia solani]|uniref:Zn(2)-C6 fungal-type domain-containing protein n=1 Tax=Rhizoctonia solani TaxID=456999 RepID=A0A8H3B1B0_9AGAM|nr:unnamed protein product [Rhizoctonia solani]